MLKLGGTYSNHFDLKAIANIDKLPRNWVESTFSLPTIFMFK